MEDKIEELIQACHFQKFIKTDTNTYRSLQRDRYPSRGQKEYKDRSGRGDSRRCDDNQHSTRQRRSESPVRSTRPRSKSPERNNRARRKVQEVINTIVGSVSLGTPEREINTIDGGFARGGCSNSVRKKNLRAIQLVHSTSTRNRPRMPPITFTKDDFTAIDPAQDDPMVIDKFVITKVLVD